MPSAGAIKHIISIVSLVVLLVSLGAASTSLGLIHTNTNGGLMCRFFVTESQAKNASTLNYNVPTCKLSLASSIIATVCLAILTVIELISVAFQKTVKSPIAKILQVVLFAGSIIFLFITMVVVSAGWAKTCATYKKLMHQLTLRDDASISITFDTVFKCTGPQNSLAGAIPPNGAEIITAAVFAGFGTLLVVGVSFLFVVQQKIRVRSPNRSDSDESLMTM